MRALPSTAGALLLIGAAVAVFQPRNASDRSVPSERSVRSHKSTPPPTPLPPLTITPATLGVPSEIPPIDHPERIRRAISTGDDAALTRATVAWFEADPIATRDWLASQPTLADLQPALAGIAIRLAECGKPDDALLWAEILEPSPARDDAIFSIHALGLRHRMIAAEEVRKLRLPEAMLRELESGAAGD